MKPPQQLKMLSERLWNSQDQQVAEDLRWFNEEQLIAWAASLVGGPEFITSHPHVDQLVKLLAATQILREVRRRFEVAELEE